MIVTCPGCASSYRVRNEAVPATGARMRCPKCSTLFLARPPPDAGREPSPTAPPPVAGPSFAASPAINPFTSSPPVNPFAATSLPSPSPPSRASSSPPPLAPSPAAVKPPPPLPNAHLDVDPFAHIDLDAPPPRPPMQAQPEARARTDVEIPASPSSPLAPLSASAPEARAPSRTTPETASTLAELPQQATPPRKAAELGSWAALAFSAAAALVGLVFTGWTSGALDLDEALMPVFEARFDVAPPRSFIGRDDPPLDVLMNEAVRAAENGDVGAAAIAYRRFLHFQPGHASARRGLDEAMQQLGAQPLHR